MSCVAERNELGLSPAIADRAKMIRAGVPLDIIDEVRPLLFEPEHNQHRRENYVSAPDAKPMAKDDVQNLVKLTTDEVGALRRMELANRTAFRRLQTAADELWGGWPDDDERWGLTPHEVRKLNRRQAV